MPHVDCRALHAAGTHLASEHPGGLLHALRAGEIPAQVAVDLAVWHRAILGTLRQVQRQNGAEQSVAICDRSLVFAHGERTGFAALLAAQARRVRVSVAGTQPESGARAFARPRGARPRLPSGSSLARPALDHRIRQRRMARQRAQAGKRCRPAQRVHLQQLHRVEHNSRPTLQPAGYG